MKRNREIDALRAVAISFVLFYHRAHIFPRELFIGRYFQESWTGVQLFFVISGFIVTRSLGLKAPLPLRKTLATFWLRRICRIFPLCFFSLVVSVLVLSFCHEPIAKLVPEVFRVVTFSYNYLLAKDPSLWLVWFWSLSIEEQFYLVLPFFLYFVPSARARIFLSIFIIGVITLAVRPYSEHLKLPFSFFRYSTFLNADFLIGGCLLCFVSSTAIKLSLLKNKFFLVLANFVLFTFLFLAPAFIFSPSLLYPCLLGASSTLVFLASLQRGLILPGIAEISFVQWLASRSYAIYVIHVPCFWIAHQVFNTNRSLGITSTTLLAISMTAVVSEILHRFLEKPLIEFSRKFEASSYIARISKKVINSTATPVLRPITREVP